MTRRKYPYRIVDLYRHDGHVLPVTNPDRIKRKPAKRGIIKADEPSRESLQNLIFLLNNCEPRLDHMLTLTMPPLVFQSAEPSSHKRIFQTCLQRLRRQGVDNYCWVREYQANGSLHWHVFCQSRIWKGPIDYESSKEWSKWFASRYEATFLRTIGLDEELSEAIEKTGKAACRIERLRCSASGRYAAKEGAKRFQKKAPDGFTGFAWWRASRSLIVKPVMRVRIDSDKLTGSEFTLPSGETYTIDHRYQFNLRQRLEALDGVTNYQSKVPESERSRDSK